MIATTRQIASAYFFGGSQLRVILLALVLAVLPGHSHAATVNHSFESRYFSLKGHHPGPRSRIDLTLIARLPLPAPAIRGQA
jgi:hypothetical protein